MDIIFDKKWAPRMGKILVVLGAISVFYVGMKFVNETKSFTLSQTDLNNATTIDVSGDGFALAVPDIANESFTVEQKSSTMKEAEDVVAKKAKEAVSFLKNSNIADKDIQTINYSAYPDYNTPPPCNGGFCASTNFQPKIIGYSVSETFNVKIRDTSSVGKIIDGLGLIGVTGLSGPNFTVDDLKIVNALARKNAIDDAKSKAQVLAKDLGVKLIRIIRFSENNGVQYPMMLNAKVSAPVPDVSSGTTISVGQNKYSSNVTITYEIQ